jgi:putative transposase
MDAASGNILGYPISQKKGYNSIDVMECIKNAVIPYEENLSKIDSVTYQEPSDEKLKTKLNPKNLIIVFGRK